MIELTLFQMEVPLGALPVGQKFIYDGWGHGTVTHNNGRTHRAAIKFHGHQVATVEAPNPGFAVEVIS